MYVSHLILCLCCKFHGNSPNDCQDIANLLLGYSNLGHSANTHHRLTVWQIFAWRHTFKMAAMECCHFVSEHEASAARLCHMWQRTPDPDLWYILIYFKNADLWFIRILDSSSFHTFCLFLFSPLYFVGFLPLILLATIQQHYQHCHYSTISQQPAFTRITKP